MAPSNQEDIRMVMRDTSLNPQERQARIRQLMSESSAAPAAALPTTTETTREPSDSSPTPAANVAAVQSVDNDDYHRDADADGGVGVGVGVGVGASKASDGVSRSDRAMKRLARSSRMQNSATSASSSHQDRLAKLRNSPSSRATAPGSVPEASAAPRGKRRTHGRSARRAEQEESNAVEVNSSQRTENEVTSNNGIPVGHFADDDQPAWTRDNALNLSPGVENFSAATNSSPRNRQTGTMRADVTCSLIQSHPTPITPGGDRGGQNQGENTLWGQSDQNEGAAVNPDNVENGQQNGNSNPEEQDQVIDGIQAFVPDTPGTNAVDALQVTAVKSEAEEEREEEKKRRRYFQIGAICIFIILVAIVVPTSVVLSRQGGGDTKIVSQSEAPSMMPSSAPTSGFFAAFTSVVRTLYDDDESYNVVFSDLGSPQYRAAQWVTGSGALDLPPNDRRMISRYALATLFYATEGENWLRCSPADLSCRESERWLVGQNECSWIMIKCNNDGGVREIRSPTSSEPKIDMAGTLPFELSLLTDLTLAAFSFNSIGGSLPESMVRLTKLLTFIAVKNQLTGLPAFLFSDRMVSLRSLLLRDNPLRTSLPEAFNSTTLTQISLPSCGLSGTIPSQISSLVNLVEIELWNNPMLRGDVPLGLFALPLFSLQLQDNPLLGGSLPDDIGQLTKLEILNIRNTSHIGELPESFYSMASISELFLSDCSFSGRLSAEGIVRFTMMEIVHLSNNQFSGVFPSNALAGLSNLRQIEAHGNNFIGNVTTSLCNRTENSLLTISVDCTGDPPEVFCDCCENCQIVP